MIRNLIDNVRQRVSKYQLNEKPDSDHSVPFEVESLEDRILLTFIGFFDGITLDINQTNDDGDVLIENSTGVWRATDNSSTFTFVNAANIEVNLLDNTINQLDFAIDLEHTGDVTLNLGNGTRQAFMTGVLNELGGDLTINAGNNNQEITLAADGAGALIAHGSIIIDLGQQFDTVLDNGSLVTADVDMFLTGVNDIQMNVMAGLFGPPITDGDVTIDNSIEEVESFVDISGTILGNFSYTGGDDIDHILSTAAITGTTDIDLDVGVPFFGDPQNVNLLGSHEGDVTIVAGDSNLGNDINLEGAFTGNIVSYTGGSLVDDVFYSFTGEQADVFIDMGAGDDIFTIDEPINLLEVDFGNDFGDTFVNALGKIEFEFDVTNFHFFDHFYTALDDTYRMVQLADTGNVTLDNDGGISGFDWQVFTGTAGFGSIASAENLFLTMLPNTGNNVEIDLFNPLIASITMNLGDGDRMVEFTGIANNPLRDININAGAGNQHVDLSVNQPLGVASLRVNLGTGFDSVDDNANSLIIDEDLIFIGVNEFIHDGLLSVFRDARIDTTMETQDTLFDSNGSMFVGRFFTYTGGNGADDLQLNGIGGTEITRNALIDLGGSTAGADQFIRLNSPDVRFNQMLTVRSANLLGTDFFNTNPGTEFGGNIDIDLGNGMNVATLVGEFTGSSTVVYTGGSGADIVKYGLTGNPIALSVFLDGGDDSLELLAGSNLKSPLFVDFGTGNDTFINGIGSFTFDATLLGLHGFNHEYVHATGTLTSTQFEDVGDIKVDNNGPSQAIRFLNGGTSTLTSVTNLNIDLLGGTLDNLDIDLDNALAGNLNVALGFGTRTVNFTGTDNSIGGNLTVVGSNDDQTINLAMTSGFTVGGNALFNLGNGNDAVDENDKIVDITGDLDFVGVNLFENGGIVSVGGHLTVDNSGESQASKFDDDNSLSIGGHFIYTGGDESDEVTLNGAIGGTMIGGNALINVGDSISGGTQFIWINSPLSSIGGILNVTSTSSLGFDSFQADAATSFGDDISIDLGGGSNFANIIGVFGGTDVTYDGGSGVDNVAFGTTGSPADVVVNLGLGDDFFTLNAGASIQPTTLTVDFGGGADTFNNAYGNFDFNANLLNLNGFSHVYNLASDALTSTQVAASSPVTIDNNGVNNAIRFIDGSISELTTVSELTVNMLDNSGTDLTVRLDNALTGDLALNLGDGGRTVSLDGTDNSIGGHLNITGGAGAQNVDVAVNNTLAVGGNAVVDLGAGSDTVEENGNDINIANDLDFVGVNSFTNDGNMTVGGNFVVNNSAETDPSLIDDNGSMNIGGHFIYTGGMARDQVLLNGVGGTVIGGDALVKLGNNSSGGTQSVWLNSALSSVGGRLDVTSTEGTNADSVRTDAGTSIGGDIKVNLGNGPNEAVMLGILGGSNVKYVGGNGTDNVTLGTTGNPAVMNMKLGGGDDNFTLNAGTDITGTLRIDFGGGTDTFQNNFGAFTFNANMINWNGYDRFYNHAMSDLNITQIANTGNITINNNGAGGAIRLINGPITEMTQADNIRLTMLANSNTDVNIDYDNAQSGKTILDLKNGDRVVRFTGSNNSIGDFLRIDAGINGIQNIFLAVNADLNVTNSVVINLREGVDAVDDGNHDVNVGTNFILRSVNTFRNDHAFNVGGFVTINTTFDNVATLVDNKGTFDVAGNFSFFGGTAADNVFLKGANIGGAVSVDLADGIGNQTADFSMAASVGRLKIIGGTAFGGVNRVVTDATTNVDTDAVVSFVNSSSVNNVTLLGTYGGTYGTYRGGSGIDNVTFGAIAANMNFVAKLGNGNDRYTLKSGTDLLQTFINFGGGDDTFVDEIGAPYPFPVSISNL